MSYDASPDSFDRELVLEFFWKFSVFECALKRESFLRKSSWAQPDWDKFGKAIQGKFAEIECETFHLAVRKLKEANPRKQIVGEDLKIGWKALTQRPQESDEQFVLKLLRTVRNNLFHGGKYPDGSVDEIARDKELLKAALEVLEGCYSLHPEINQWRLD